MQNITTNLSASPSREYGEIQVSWDIPENFYYGNYSYMPPEHISYLDTLGMSLDDAYPAEWGQIENGWMRLGNTAGAFSNMGQIPNFNTEALNLNSTHNRYKVAECMLGYPNPKWLYSAPGLANYNHSTYTFANLGDSQPAFIIANNILEDFISVGGNQDLYDFTNFTTDTHNAIKDNIQNYQNDYAQGYPENFNNVHVLKGVSYKNVGGGLQIFYDWSDEQYNQVDVLLRGMRDPDGNGGGVYRWVGGLLNNKLFNPNYAQEETASIKLNFAPGFFDVCARKRELPTDLLGGPEEVGGQLHPTPEQLEKWLDPSYNNRSFKSFRVYPTVQEMTSGEIERTFPLEDTTWRFIVLYTDGHTLYPHTHHPSDNGVSGQTYVEKMSYLGYGEENHLYQVPAVNNLSSLTNGTILTNDLETGVDYDQNNLDNLFNNQHTLTPQRTSNYFISEVGLGLQSAVEMPYLLDDNSYQENLEQTQIDYGFGEINHDVLINGNPYNSVKNTYWRTWGEGSAYATATPNMSVTDFGFNMRMNPEIFPEWEDDWGYRVLNDKIANTPGVHAKSADELYQANWDIAVHDGVIDDSEQDKLFHLRYYIGNSETFRGLRSYNQLTSIYLAHFMEYNPIQGGYGAGGYAGGNRFVWSEENLNWSPFSGQDHIRPGRYYIRLKNKIVFLMEHENVPSNFMIRVINQTESGNYETHNPTGNDDFSEMPIFYDYTERGGGGTLPFQRSVFPEIMMNSNKYCIEIPIDTTLESDGERMYKIMWGYYNPNEVVNNNPSQCTDTGGAYGMYTLDTQSDSLLNRSDYSNSGKYELIPIYYKNTAPEVKVAPLPNVNLSNPNNPSETLVLRASLNTGGIPGFVYTTGYEYEAHLPGQYYDDAPGAYQDVAYAEIGGVTNSCGYMGANNQVALCSLVDVAGNRTVGHTTWNYYAENRFDHHGDVCENMWDMSYGGAYDGLVFTAGQVINIVDWARAHAPKFLYVMGCEGDQWEGQNLYCYSTNKVICRKLGLPLDTDPRYLMDLGYVSYELLYNQWGHGIKHLIEKTNTGEMVDQEDIHQAMLYDECTAGGFRLDESKFPSDAEIYAWSGTSMEEGFPVYADNWEGGMTFMTLVDPFFKNLTLQADSACSATGKFGFALPMMWENGCDKNRKKWYEAWNYYQRVGSAVDAFSASTFIAPTDGIQCGEDPGNVAGFGGGGGGGGGAEIEYINNPKYYLYNTKHQRWDVEDLQQFAYDETSTGMPPWTDQVDDDVSSNFQRTFLTPFKSSRNKLYTLLDTRQPGTLEKSEVAELYAGAHHKWNWVSKKLIFGKASQDKMFYKIRVARDIFQWNTNNKYLEISVRTDNPILSYDNDGNPIDTVSAWHTQLVEPGHVIDLKIPKSCRKGKWIQIQVTGTGKDEITSLSVIWRPRRIK